MNVVYILSNEKHFSKSISQWEFDYGLFTNLPRNIVACDFSRSSYKLREVSYLSWQNTYTNLKTTRHIKLKFFLRTKLLENLLLVKYLISVSATLMSIITLWKVNVFSIGKELHESILILAKLWLILFVIPFFFTYKIINPIINCIIFFRTK